MASKDHRGLTLVELLVVVAITAILLMITVPAFQNLISAKRAEGVASEFVTDLEFARSEAVARSKDVSVSLVGTGCYIISVAPMTAPVTSCPPLTTDGVIKLRQLEAGSATFSVSTTAASNMVQFNSLRGTRAESDPRAVAVTFTSGSSSSIQVTVDAIGKISTCAPTGSTVTGVKAC